ncbi:WD40/YVTN/BNR-like repeat-containing protein [candidate division KSB1 bacterium]
MYNHNIRISIKIAAVLCLILFAGLAFAQTAQENYIKDLQWRNIGPANMSGRISDIEALNDDFTHVLVASASGGVWKSTNAGTTFEPIFDKYGAASIGDIAISQKNPDIIWVGTGERNPRNSIAWGNGVYKSTDGGRTFNIVGLEDTHAIGRIIIHPDNPDIVWVAAPGHLWGYSGDRGLYKTTDGGQTWEKLTNGLPDDGKTGAIDLIINPKNKNELFVSMWERLRTPWRFDSGGPNGGEGNGGIYKTTNGGNSWKKLTKGLPEGQTGKIGLAIAASNPKVVMAFLEHTFQPSRQIRNADGTQVPNPEYNDLSRLGSGVYRSEDGGNNWTLMNRYQNRPFYYSHIYINPSDDKKVYLLAQGHQISLDGGKTLINGPGGHHGDYHALWLDPTNPDRYYIGSDGGVSITHDHQNYTFFDNYVISQFYAVGADMRDPYYVAGGLQDNGTWIGPSKSRNSAIFTSEWYSIGGGDGFHAQADPLDWRTWYVESQGGSVSRVNVETRQSSGIRPSRNNITNYSDYIQEAPAPPAELRAQQGQRGGRGGGRNPFRFNWSAPIVLSPHNPHTIFFGGNYLFKSVDRGDHWEIISPDLTTNDPVKTDRNTGGITRDATGAENHCNIITISQSSINPALIWAGTDDGNVQITRNGGKMWTNVRSRIPEVPDGIWVSRVETSHFDEGTCYVTFDGHRSDNFDVWVFMTTDYGQSWTKITNGIEFGNCMYVIKEDLKNPNLLFAGSEFFCFFSLNKGQTWSKLNLQDKDNGYLPTVAIHDLLIHPRDGDLIAATHGRGIWILDDITSLQQATEEVLGTDAQLFESRTSTQWMNQTAGTRYGTFRFYGENPPNNPVISYYLRSPAPVDIVITDVTGTNKRTFTISGEAGINRLTWDMAFDPSARQIEQTIAQAQQQIEQQIQQATGAQRSQLQQLLNDARNVGTDLRRYNEFQAKQREIMGGGGRGGRGRGGSRAGVGEYGVTMTVFGQSFTNKLTIRADPLVSGR